MKKHDRAATDPAKQCGSCPAKQMKANRKPNMSALTKPCMYAVQLLLSRCSVEMQASGPIRQFGS
jgi:hypothetical protein